jgi:hypothetical protein
MIGTGDSVQGGVPVVNIRNKEGSSVTEAPSVVGKRVNFVLSERAYTELVNLSKETMRSMTELVRLGLGLVKIAIEAERRGQRLIVTTAEGDPVKEIVLPG